MKKTILGLMMICFSVTGFSQSKSSNVSHEGFYLSMGTGPALGNVRGDNNGNITKIKGEAYGFDFQIGGAIKPNLILHASVQNKTLVGPKINNVKEANDHTFHESFYGVGVTKYTKENFFFTGNVGIGHFTTSESENGSNFNGTTTDPGFSFNVKAGKEWMVSRKWGLGGGLFYGKTTLKNTGSGYSEKWNSNRFGLYFQATLCKSTR